jgi:hypothetical protein
MALCRVFILGIKNTASIFYTHYQGALMAVKRATLIQDVADLFDVVNPCLKLILSYYAVHRISHQDAMRWILCEEIALMYGLYDNKHVRNQPPYRYIYDYLNAMLPFPVSIYIRQYVAAPKIYPDDNTIDVSLHGRDLYIRYSTRSNGLQLTYLQAPS